MALDQYIKANKIRPNRGGGRGRGGRGRRGRGQGRGGNRGAMKGRGGGQTRGRGGQRGRGGARGGQAKRGFFRPRAGANVARNFGQQQTGPAKIQLTNLDFGVSDGDIKELFSEFGSLKMAAIHYNAQGKSMGTASLVYARRGDAIKAIKQYNGVALDGRTMNLKLEGAQQGGFNKTSPVKRLGRGAAGVRGGRGGARGGAGGKFKARGGAKRGAKAGRGGAKAGRGGKKFQKPKPKTAEEL